ncbi:MAG: S1 RNA-binding domain-containing protein [Turicibacter sp.]
MSITAGQKLQGKITSVKKFGAFVELENGQSGLVHISELSEKFVEKVEDVVSVGQEVTVRVKEVTGEGKINLSMKPERPARPARPALNLDQAITNFLKDSDEKQTAMKKNLKTQRRRSN